MREFGAPLLVVLLLLCATACPGAARKEGTDDPVREPPPASRAAVPERLLDRLDERVRRFVLEVNRVPDFAPIVDEATDDRIVLVSLDFGVFGATHHGEPVVLREGSTTVDRLAIGRQAVRPDYWVVMTDSDADRVLYWAPVRVPDRVRVEYLGDGRKPPSARHVLPPANRVAVRLPYHEGALVALVAADLPVRLRSDDVLVFDRPWSKLAAE